jgi:hypothetical protein
MGGGRCVPHAKLENVEIKVGFSSYRAFFTCPDGMKLTSFVSAAAEK